MAPSPTTASLVLLMSSYTNLSPPPLETGKAQLLGHTQHPLSPVMGATEASGHRVPLRLCTESHRIPSGSGLSPLQAQGHRVNCSPLGREHSNFRLLPCEMSSLGHKEILCSRSIKGICVSLPTGTDPAQGKQLLKRQQHRMGQCRDKGALSFSKAGGCPLPLLASALPSPSAREATYRNMLAGPQSTTQPPPQSPVPCQQSRAQFTRETSASCRNVFHLWAADAWQFPSATPVLG